MNSTEAPSMGSANLLEMIIPPFCVIVLIYIGLLLLSLITQPLWWTSGFGRTKEESPVRKVRVSSFETIKVDPSEIFLGPSDQHTLFRFKAFQNNPVALFMLSLPAILSLVFCPATLYLAPKLVAGVWPPHVFPKRPNVNDAIACFLTPSGLVYAIAFGFAFQEALTKQITLAGFFNDRLSTLHDLLFLIKTIKIVTPKVKAASLLILKDEIVTWMKVILKKDRRKTFQNDTHRMMQIFDNEGLLQQSDSKLLDELWENIKRLHSMGPDRTVVLLYASHVSFLQWLFLETLGFVTYFGVLLIKAQSYRMELCMCMLTVFTISMFVNVLADYDNPLHGFFRVKLDGYDDLIGEMKEHYSHAVRAITPIQKGSDTLVQWPSACLE